MSILTVSTHKLHVSTDTSSPEEIANLFGTIYPEKSNRLNSDYFAWRYSHAYPEGSRSVFLRAGEKLVGHAGILLQPICVLGSTKLAAQLVDLAIHPRFRGLIAVRKIYRAMQLELAQLEPDMILTLPNEKANRLNRRILNMSTVHSIPLWSVVALPTIGREQCLSFQVTPELASNSVIMAQIGDYLASDRENGFIWTQQTLLSRLCDPVCSYHLHIANGWMIVTKKGVKQGLPYFIIMSVFTGPAGTKTREPFARVLRSIVRHHRTPVGVYWGNNASVQAILEQTRFARQITKSFALQHDGGETANNVFGTRIELLELDIQ